MTRLEKIMDGVWVDADRFMAVTMTERNLAPAFVHAILVERGFLERFLNGKLSSAHDIWFNPEGEWGLSCSEWTMPPLQAFADLGAKPEPLLGLEWGGFGTSSGTTYYLARDLLGHDIVFRYCEVESCPTVLVRTAGLPALEETVARTVCDELADSQEFGGLPSRIENLATHLIEPIEIARAVYRRLEREDGWDEALTDEVFTAVYPDEPERLLRTFTDALKRSAGLYGNIRVESDPDPGEPLTDADKDRLLRNYMARCYFREPWPGKKGLSQPLGRIVQPGE